MLCTLLSEHLSTTVPTESKLLPSTEPAFFINLSSLFLFLSIKLTPQQHTAERSLPQLVKHVQHVPAHIEGPQLLEKVKPALPFLIECISVGCPVQHVIKVHLQVGLPVGFNHLNVRTLDVDWQEQRGLRPPEIDDHLLILRGV